MNIKILDCTLRDGGYANDWNFGKKNIKKIIKYLLSSNIEIIECGFLSNKAPYNAEKSIFDSVERFKEVIVKKNVNSKYVAMINYGEYNVEDIPNYDGTSIDGIRVAFHKKDIDGAINFCKRLSEKGYLIFVQPMVTISYSDMDLLRLIKMTNEIKPFAFYIVDSFGVMKKNDLLRIFYLVNNNLDKRISIGYHSHNNLQLAYSNAQALVKVDVNRNIIIDSSVLGMGRGAGNLNTELFIQYLNDRFHNKYNTEPLLQIIDEILNPIYSVNYWGYSLPHYLSAVYNCHPNYATYLAEKNTLSAKSISEILNQIFDEQKYNFNKNYIEDLYLNYQKHYINDFETIVELEEQLNGKDVVIIAPGKSIKGYYDDINEIINKKNTVAISVNFIPDEFKCDFTFISNEKRFKSIIENNNLELSKIKTVITSNINYNNTNFLKVNYGDLLNGTESVKDNSTLMLLKLLAKINVNRILLAGFDGYTNDNTENYADKHMILTTSNDTIKELNEGISKHLKKLHSKVKIEFITPSKYLHMNTASKGEARYE